MVRERVFSFVRGTTEGIADRASETGGQLVEEVKGRTAKAARSAAGTVIGGALQQLGETIARYGESVAGPPGAQTLPPAEGSGFSEPPPPVAISAKMGSPLVFIVNRGVRYRAEWGDGTSDEGTKGAGETVLLRHGWETPGDYVVKLVTFEGAVSEEALFPVRIYRE